MPPLTLEHDGHGIGDFGCDQAAIAGRRLEPRKGMQERSRSGRIDRREGEGESADDPAQHVPRPRYAERGRSFGANAKLLLSGDDGSGAFQNHDLPRPRRQRFACARRERPRSASQERATC